LFYNSTTSVFARRIDPDHAHAEKLHAGLLEQISRRDKAVGIAAVVGFGLAGAAGVVAALLLNSQKRR
jgi:hypothetical protein